VHSSHTVWISAALRNDAGRSPRSSDRPQIWQVTGLWLVCSWRVAIAPTLAQASTNDGELERAHTFTVSSAAAPSTFESR